MPSHFDPNNSTPPEIRLAAAADAGDLAAFAARVFRETFAADNTEEDMARFLAGTFTPERQAAELADPDVTTMLALLDGQLAGFAQVRTGEQLEEIDAPDPVELWRIYVDRAWHGRGVAQALMDAVEAEARRRGARSLWLGVWERNDRAQAFYRKFGFETVGSHVFVLGDDRQTDLIMLRTLV